MRRRRRDREGRQVEATGARLDGWHTLDLAALMFTAWQAHGRRAVPPCVGAFTWALLREDLDTARAELGAWATLRERAPRSAAESLWRLACAIGAELGLAVVGAELARGEVWDSWEIACAVGGIPAQERTRARAELGAAMKGRDEN